MCGIAGFLDAGRAPAGSPTLIQAMLGHIGHRGPDGLGCVVDDRGALGTARLAIIDPEGAAQPMADASGRYWLCYNGEVYNYIELRAELEARGVRFATDSDTEVVLQAWLHWGPDCLPRFNGGFAFALYDSLTGALVLARDRFGKRPLFLLRRGDALYFASEMKAFLAVPDFSFEQDPAQLASILATWTPLPDQTGFHGIASLPMGEWLEFSGGEERRHRYDILDFTVHDAPADEVSGRARIRKALEEATKLRLRASVEVGVYLSGGVDSAIVAMLAARHAPKRLSTFSVAFADAAFDESAEQLEMAAFLGSDHHMLRIESGHMAQACPAAVFHAEVPAFRSAFIPMYLLGELTRANGIKVVLSGEGADEAFLGYDLFKETMLRRAWPQMDEAQRREKVAGLYPHLGHYGGDDLAAMTGLYQQFAQERMPGLFSHEMRFQNGRFATRLLQQAGDPFAPLAALVAAEPGYAGLDDVRKAQWLEYRTLLSGYLLSTQGERMSLAHGVENRCPFLDMGVVAAANATNLRFDDGFREKRMLREAFRADLPPRIVAKRKFPYRAPDSAAFAATRPDYLELLLSDGELAKLPFLDARFARRLTDKVMTRPGAEIGTKEDQAFMFLLSIVLLHHQFVARHLPAARRTPAPMRMVDRRTT